MKPWEESDRYNYPVANGWVVMDVGAHHGEFALNFWDAHKGKHLLIRSYEPVPEFYEILKANVGAHKEAVNITMIPRGLGATTRKQMFRVKGDMSGPWADDGPTMVVDIDSIAGEFLHGVPVTFVDLIKINVEGGEYELLEAILDQGLVRNFGNLQIQYHAIPDINPVERWKKIRSRLTETHRLMYADPSMEFHSNSWEGWTLR